MKTLLNKKNWVLWRLEKVADRPKPAKVPYYVNLRGELIAASTGDPETWTDYPTATNQARKHKIDGIGLVFDGAGIGVTGIDLDNCIDEAGKMRDEAHKIITLFDSYTEKSQSGRGLHILVKGHKLDDWACRKEVEGIGIEIYDTGRYFAMANGISGNFVSANDEIKPRQAELEQFYLMYFGEAKKPIVRTIQPIGPGGQAKVDEVLARLQAAKNSEKFARLFAGEWSGYPSQSEADLALCAMVAFYAPDEAVIDEVVRRSKLYRDKWEDNEGYRNNTIATAIKNTLGEFRMSETKVSLREKALAKCKEQPKEVGLKIEAILQVRDTSWKVSILPENLGLGGRLPVMEWIAEKLIVDFDDAANVIKIPDWLYRNICQKYADAGK